MKLKGASAISAKWMVVLCVSSFLVGMLFTNRMWNMSEDFEAEALKAPVNTEHLQLVTEIQCDPKPKPVTPEREVYVEVSKTHQAIRNLDKTISSLEMELAAVRAAQASTIGGGAAEKPAMEKTGEARQKVFVVIGINTAFSSRKRRDSIRETWMPTGEKRKQLEQEKGIIIKFVIGHSATPGGILDNAIEAEDAQHGDFLRLVHAFLFLFSLFFLSLLLFPGMLTVTLARHRSKPRAYIGCMKSGPVLAQKGVKYHEPEYWKFGEDGNRYFRHATGQVYAISRDLATYISINQPILHKYANEDVSLGSWFIGLDVDHIDDRSFCCGTPPDCEWKAQAGSVCVGSFDWTCSGICRSVERLGFVHQRCGEGDSAVWNAVL
ncbi:probable beta-1,3-galactosyltransferase 2 [Selaginella moellendorffii]|uniref:probable beta-1,3-galactosyltransferase 2 n=1 Tax=Selaginella moellendorffii TaxID=88036 RepID=UPI000D1CC46C|nr:probable beta-1,3-galactosyltransferase 2 [Selaginella moellendorffii]|eukprot:XP_024524805.1 probable beta-1,3-galactosyltransferase 2 [Selaginella moellendorffii]